MITNTPTPRRRKDASVPSRASKKSPAQSQRDPRPIVLEAAPAPPAGDGSAHECFLTIEDAADRSRMSVAWWRREVRAGAIPIMALGRAVRISETDFATYMAARRGRRKAPGKSKRFKG
jgi:excisionase family DNA binding protein